MKGAETHWMAARLSDPLTWLGSNPRLGLADSVDHVRGVKRVLRRIDIPGVWERIVGDVSPAEA
jgi:hypothetical protein